MDEQRILDEMERMLAADDPRLAARLAAFGQPGFGQALRTRRARATLSVMVLVLIAAVAAVIYLMSVLRPGPISGTHGPGQRSSAPPLVTQRTGKPGSTARPAVTSQPTSRRSTSDTAPCAATLAPPRCANMVSAFRQMPGARALAWRA
jgi:hypothetical protein